MDKLLGQLTAAEEYLSRVTQILSARIQTDSHAHLQQEQALFDALVKMMAQAIDRKSHHTGSHCMRVPILGEMIVRAACAATDGPYQDFSMTPEQQYEFHVACWLHDCGKIVTPTHIMEKSTKLETIIDRIDLVVTRFEIAMRDADNDPEITMSRNKLRQVLAMIRRLNLGQEPLTDEALEQLQALGEIFVDIDGMKMPLLSHDEISHLSIRHGTITEDERAIMRDHINHTAFMLESLPWPERLKSVPAYAVTHHERMDGTGYPAGIKAGSLPLPSRILALADIFEAITAADRPYKRPNRLSEAMALMAQFKRNNHLDPELVDFFVRSGIYKEFARQFLEPEQIDEVDEQAVLTAKPLPMAA